MNDPRIKQLAEDANQLKINKKEWNVKKIGIINSAIEY